MACNHLLQKYGGALRNDDFIHRTFRDDMTVLFERMKLIGVEASSARVFEIGTGWLPIFPLCLALCGFRNIYTVDLSRHLRPAAVRRTLLALREHLSDPSLLAFSSADKIAERFETLLRAQDILAAAGITYLAPCDASQTGLKPGSVDLIVSNNVFEHVPQPALVALFEEARRLLSMDGHILHCVNCGDHYAYSDSGISQINYMQFSEKEWARWNNSIQYQNRLRPIDFINMADMAGFSIKSAEYTPNERYLRELAQMEIAPEFRHYSLEQLASTSLTLIGHVG